MATIAQVREMARRYGFALVPTGRVKTIEVYEQVSVDEVPGIDSAVVDAEVSQRAIEQIGHGIAAKLFEHSKVLVTRLQGAKIPQTFGPGTLVYHARLDIIVPEASPEA